MVSGAVVAVPVEERAKQLPHSWDGQGSPQLGDDGAEHGEQLFQGDTEPGTCTKASLRGLPTLGKQEANSCAQAGLGGSTHGQAIWGESWGEPRCALPCWLAASALPDQTIGQERWETKPPPSSAPAWGGCQHPSAGSWGHGAAQQAPKCCLPCVARVVPHWCRAGRVLSLLLRGHPPPELLSQGSGLFCRVGRRWGCGQGASKTSEHH